jgi:hypothetical protein
VLVVINLYSCINAVGHLFIGYLGIIFFTL